MLVVRSYLLSSASLATVRLQPPTVLCSTRHLCRSRAALEGCCVSQLHSRKLVTSSCLIPRKRRLCLRTMTLASADVPDLLKVSKCFKREVTVSTVKQMEQLTQQTSVSYVMASQPSQQAEGVMVEAGCEDDSAILVDVKTEAEAEAAGMQPKRKRRRTPGKVENVVEGNAAAPDTPSPKRRQRRKTQTVTTLKAEATEDGAVVVTETIKQEFQETEELLPVKRSRTKKQYLEMQLTVPSMEQVAIMRQQGFTPAPLPVPVLGYACLNMTLREKLKVPIYTNRDCTQKTYLTKGLDYISELTLLNVSDLPKIIQWNHEQNIRLFRLSSCLVPWMTEVKDIRRLKHFQDIAEQLRWAGELAKLYDQRLTFHPSHFVCLASPHPDKVDNSITELEIHSQIFDLMGYEPSPWNKINIHIGGVYGDKLETLQRFEQNWRRLSPSCRARLTVENDDTPNAFSLHDLLPLAQATGIPLVFDFHHHKFIETPLSEKESVHAAYKTWPQGVRPVVHWSESQEGRMAKAHSDYVYGPMILHGLEDKVDVMIEAKCKELALQEFLNHRTESKKHDVAGSSIALKFL